jgi:hypothetical protein
LIHSAKVHVVEGQTCVAAARVYLAGKGALIGCQCAAGIYSTRACLDIAA